MTMIRAGAGAKTAGAWGMPVSAAVRCARSTAMQNEFIWHINNTNPMLIEGSPNRTARAAGWDVAATA
jgi:hypothetical protein